MTLYEHLRELQMRLFRSALAIVVAAIVGWVFYEQLFTFLSAPMQHVVDEAQASGREVTLAIGGVTEALTLKLQVAGVFGLIASAPIWLYQLWRYIAPGLHGHERKWAYVFAGAATPLFVAGVAFGYTVMPQMLQALLGLTPDSVENIVQVDSYLSFILQVLVFFGIGFLVPLVFVMLNLAGILSAQRFSSWWRVLILASFVFGAVATPTGDPFWMTMAAAPMLGLLVVAWVLMWLVDKRRARRARRAGYAQWGDDEISPLDDVDDIDDEHHFEDIVIVDELDDPEDTGIPPA